MRREGSCVMVASPLVDGFSMVTACCFFATLRSRSRSFLALIRSRLRWASAALASLDPGVRPSFLGLPRGRCAPLSSRVPRYRFVGFCGVTGACRDQAALLNSCLGPYFIRDPGVLKLTVCLVVPYGPAGRTY